MSPKLQTELEDDGLEAPVSQQLVPDRLPTIDDDEPQATYLDYSMADTRVITYAIGTDFKGVYVESVGAAKLHAKRNYGKILDIVTLPGRAFIRVFKERK